MTADERLRERGDAILQEIRELLGPEAETPPLNGPDYMRCHVAFEGASDQQDQIRSALTQVLLSAPQADLSVASIGAGSGILDVPMLRDVCASKRVDYTVVEPVPEQCVQFEQRVRATLAPDNPTLHFENRLLCEVPVTRRYDFVLAIHCLYYMDDLKAAVGHLLSMCKFPGTAIIAMAPLGFMNRLASVFWAPQLAGSVTFDTDVAKNLKERNAGYRESTVQARLAIPMDEGPEADDILSFLIQTRFDALDPAVRNLIRSYVRTVGTIGKEEIFLPHPVTMLSVTSRKSLFVGAT
jgi:hypothetical protein